MSPRRSRAIVVALLLALAASFSARELRAAWPRDPNVGNVPVAVANGSQVYPRTCPDGSGGAFIGWHDNRSGSYDLYVQRVSAAGVPMWTANGVLVCNAAGDQANAMLVADGAGGVIVTWHDARNGNWDVFVQRLDGAGAPQWTANGVALCTASGDQPDPQIVSDGAGGAIVAWVDKRGANWDIYARRIDASGTPQWTANGVAVCTATGSQSDPKIVTDGAGGAFLVWSDPRAGFLDVYAQRMNAAGVPQWTANGITVCNLVAGREEPEVVSDGLGGAIVVWHDYRTSNEIYAQRVGPSGAPLWPAQGALAVSSPYIKLHAALTGDGAGGAILAWTEDLTGAANIHAQRVSAGGARQWPTAGVPVCTAPNSQGNPAIVSDGVGGAIVTWQDGRDFTSAAHDIYAQRVNPSGVVLWQQNGKAICTAAGEQVFPSLVPTSAAGAIIAWHDSRSGNADVYCQRVERFGELGDPEPVITSVRDVPNDQGGYVKVSWAASYLDADPTYSITEYRLWRSVPGSAQDLAKFATAGATLDSDEAAATGRLLLAPIHGVNYAWELVGAQTASALASYSLVTATTADSIPGSNPLTAFMVQARTGSGAGAPNWSSPPDSGYSADNLAPPTPTPFVRNTSGGAITLSWGASPAPDFSYFRLYRGTSAGFVPGPATLLTTLTGTGYIDAYDENHHYKLSAVDIHGNASGFATASPPGTVDVTGDALPATFRLAAPEPNPARLGTRFAFDLPRPGHVVLAVYDLGGRRIRELHRGTTPAGRHPLHWDLRDDAGAMVSSGIYLVRLEAGDLVLTRRMIAIR